MGIYIPGMEFPKEKKITLTLFQDGRVYENHGERLWGNGKDCIPWKAVNVPAHGRLIDADEMRDEWLISGENDYIYDTNSFLDSIDNASTIIEAEWKNNGAT